jgi:TonB family protein
VLWFNRFYIISSVLFAAALPLLHLHLPVKGEINMLPNVVVGGGYTLLETITVFGENTNRFAAYSLDKFPWLSVFYITGISILVFRLVISIFNLRSFHRKAKIERLQDFILVDILADHSPFSFFRFLFINRSKYDEDELNTIVKHELTHIQLKHTFDILLVELVLIIQWFNPFIWLLRIDLKEVHEFQADRRALQSGINPGFYKKLLLYEALGSHFVIANNLNQSLIKKRIKMMNHKINKTLGFLKPTLAAIVLALLILAFACDKQDDKVYTEVDVMPAYPGGMEALKAYVSENLKYPEEAMEQKIVGKVFVSFIVTDEGMVSNAKIERGVIEILDNEALRVVNSLPKWTPGIKDGENVNVQFTFPITFKLDEQKYSIVEEMPQFPGGEDALRKYLMENVKYPEDAKTNNKTGSSFVSFTVSTEGKIEKVKILRSSGTESLDKEALRVIQSMPGWKPGMQQGEAVPVELTIPIQFLLENNNGAIVIHQSSAETEQMVISTEFIKKGNNQLIAKGKTVDKSGKPLKGVSVIIGGTTTGTITSQDGTFELEVGNTGDELVFSYVGKKTFKMKIQR